MWQVRTSSKKRRDLDVKDRCIILYWSEYGQRGNSEHGSQGCCGMSCTGEICVAAGDELAMTRFSDLEFSFGEQDLDD